VCDEVYSSFASSAFASTSTVETKVSSRFEAARALQRDRSLVRDAAQQAQELVARMLAAHGSRTMMKPSSIRPCAPGRAPGGQLGAPGRGEHLGLLGAEHERLAPVADAFRTASPRA
jgi:hypothetical protein